MPARLSADACVGSAEYTAVQEEDMTLRYRSHQSFIRLTDYCQTTVTGLRSSASGHKFMQTGLGALAAATQQGPQELEIASQDEPGQEVHPPQQPDGRRSLRH